MPSDRHDRPAAVPDSDRRPAVRRLPFFYGWVVVAVAFVTLGIATNARNVFSLLFPPLLDEFGWDRGMTAAAFSVGLVSAMLYAPLIGGAMDRFGPRLLIPFGGLVMAAGLVLTTAALEPWQFYLTIGVLVVGPSILLSYTGHYVFLPNWFERRRGARARHCVFRRRGGGDLPPSLASGDHRPGRLAPGLLGPGDPSDRRRRAPEPPVPARAAERPGPRARR